jgi:AcrR family transcriptional regulator
MLSAPDTLPSKADFILEAATRLFARYGYRRTAMDDIAREAGVAKGTVYLYFDSKEAVYQAVQARDAAEVLARCDKALATPGAFRDRLYGLLDSMFGLFFERYGASEHAAELKALLSTIGRAAMETLSNEYRQRFVALLQGAEKAGEIDLRAAGLAAGTVAQMAKAAAVGLKYCPEASADTRAYRARLADLAALIAAAVHARAKSGD